MTELYNGRAGNTVHIAETGTECDDDSDDSLLEILNSLDAKEHWDLEDENRDSVVTTMNGVEDDEKEGVTDSESDDRSLGDCFDAVENIGDVMGENVVESVREDVMERDAGELAKRDNNNIDNVRVFRSQSINSDSSDNIITQFLDKSVEHVGCLLVIHSYMKLRTDSVFDNHVESCDFVCIGF